MSTDISSLTVAQVNAVLAAFGTPLAKSVTTHLDSVERKGHFFSIGSNYIVRTVTMIFTEKLLDVSDTELLRVDTAWVPQTERYAEFIRTGAVRECEPFPDGKEVVIGRGR